MADEEESAPSSPPLPKRGTYNIDFDSLDDSINPFQSNVQLGSSPPIKSNQIPPQFDNFDDIDDPFKSSSKLGNSPPGSPRVKSSNNNNNDVGSAVDSAVSNDLASSGELPQSEGSNEASSNQPVKEKKGTPPKKKMIKKPKVQSKFKPPKNFKPVEDNGDDIQILLPPSKDKKVDDEPENSKEEAASLPNRQEQTENMDEKSATVTEQLDCVGAAKDCVQDLDNDVPYDAAPEAMASSSEMDQQFVERETSEEPDCFSGQKPVKNEVTKADDLGALGKFSEENMLNSPDPSFSSQEKENLVKSSTSPRSTTQQLSDDDLPMTKTSPPSKSADPAGNVKHPAARALEESQADSVTKGVEPKNESSSEESQFYDAYDYPPTDTSKPKLGQKVSTMDRSPAPEEGGDKGQVVQLVQVLRYSQSDWNKLKQEMEINFQTTLLNKERDWSLMMAERDKKISTLEESNRKLKHTNEDMRMVVVEFEKTIAQLQADKEKAKVDSSKTVLNLEQERDQALDDLQSVESAFSDLHRRYEKSKSIIEGFKKNEEQLKQCVEELQNKLKKTESKLQSIRTQAEEKLDRANEDIEKIKKSTQQDIIRLEAALKKAELRNSSLEESLQRKEKENQELTAICDELIAKVGS